MQLALRTPTQRDAIGAPVDPLELPRVFVALLFVDIVQSTQLTERLGDREAYQRVHHVLSTAASCAHAVGGEVLETRGDGSLIAFDESSDALCCGLEIPRAMARSARAPLRLRMGLHAGHAALTPSGYFGRTVILAARLSDLAEAGELLVSEAVRDRVPEGQYRFDGGRSIHLKGFSGTHRVFRTCNSTPAACLPSPRSHLTPDCGVLR